MRVMYIMSEITGKKYDSVEECLAAEEAVKTEQEQKNKLKAEAIKAMQLYIENGGKLYELTREFAKENRWEPDLDNFVWKFFK